MKDEALLIKRNIGNVVSGQWEQSLILHAYPIIEIGKMPLKAPTHYTVAESAVKMANLVM